MSTPSVTRSVRKPSQRSSRATWTDTGPTPAISHISSADTEPRRSAAASTRTSTCGAQGPPAATPGRATPGPPASRTASAAPPPEPTRAPPALGLGPPSGTDDRPAAPRVPSSARLGRTLPIGPATSTTSASARTWSLDTSRPARRQSRLSRSVSRPSAAATRAPSLGARRASKRTAPPSSTHVLQKRLRWTRRSASTTAASSRRLRSVRATASFSSLTDECFAVRSSSSAASGAAAATGAMAAACSNERSPRQRARSAVGAA